MDTDKTFSTGDVAKYCNATTASVNNWIKNNKIKAYTTPGGQYRILLKDLIEFIKKNNMPVPNELKKYLQKGVLIIDDDHKIVEILQTLVKITDSDANIYVANDGYEGLMMAGDLKPNLIFLDLQLPEIDGFEVCEKIKTSAHGTDIKIIIISAFLGQDKFKDKLKECKADEIIEKPFVMERLKEKIRELL